ncbi:CheR family methyltransferase [Pseudoduganella sp. UC29_106]|uniref:CheR family methyltransferase n=1 Tax=Pseudoduganella sp. UC29_106 TaxID=3374553 RepID=UPI0037580470
MTVQGMLKDATGLNLPRSAVERAIRARMEALGQSDRKQYAHDLMQGASPDELAQLVELVVVPESWLFRDPQAFALATEYVKGRLARGTRLVRILSLPCAGGEEPYSMAMALCDAGVPLEAFMIDAVDISADCIARAEAGIFGRNAFRSQDLAFRDRYFTPVAGSEGEHAIASSLRQRVRFRQGNVLAGGAAPSSSYDIIFCRNLLIYFDRPTAAAAAARLSALLADDGMLMAGYAEVPVFTQNGFVALPYQHAFALRKAAGQPAAPGWANLPGFAAPRRAPVRHRPPGPGTAHPGDAAACTARAVRPYPPAHRASPAAPDRRATPAAGRASAPGRAPGQEPPAPSSDALLAAARQLADQGKLKEAAAACKALLAQKPETAEAWFILGLLAEAAQDTEQAEQQLRRCLYLHPDHYEALCHLALLAEQGGNRSAAATLKARAARAYERQHASR